MYHLKTVFAIIGTVLLLGFSSCQKDDHEVFSTADQPAGLQDFTKYIISKGAQYAIGNTALSVNISELRFQVYFDSSAIYKVPGDDQYDINKLSGFADNGALHTAYSARFGWRWSDGRLRLFGFVHNKSVFQFKEISSIDIGKIYTCSIKVLEGKYVFTVEELKNSITMDRAATTKTAEGYRLYPYFGGNNIAPHEIRIWIKYL